MIKIEMVRLLMIIKILIDNSIKINKIINKIKMHILDYHLE
jgi:hypothetical protein